MCLLQPFGHALHFGILWRGSLGVGGWTSSEIVSKVHDDQPELHLYHCDPVVVEISNSRVSDERYGHCRTTDTIYKSLVSVVWEQRQGTENRFFRNVFQNTLI